MQCHDVWTAVPFWGQTTCYQVFIWLFCPKNGAAALKAACCILRNTCVPRTTRSTVVSTICTIGCDAQQWSWDHPPVDCCVDWAETHSEEKRSSRTYVGLYGYHWWHAFLLIGFTLLGLLQSSLFWDKLLRIWVDYPQAGLQLQFQNYHGHGCTRSSLFWLVRSFARMSMGGSNERF